MSAEINFSICPCSQWTRPPPTMPARSKWSSNFFVTRMESWTLMISIYLLIAGERGDECGGRWGQEGKILTTTLIRFEGFLFNFRVRKHFERAKCKNRVNNIDTHAQSHTHTRARAFALIVWRYPFKRRESTEKKRNQILRTLSINELMATNGVAVLLLSLTCVCIVYASRLQFYRSNQIESLE